MSATISPNELASLNQQHHHLHDLIDVRTPAEFTAVHAANARLVPLDQLDPKSVAADRITPDEPIYLICKTGGRATQAQKRFEAAGITNTVVVTGGTDAWVAASLPSVRGHAPMAMERQVRISAGSLIVLGALLGWGVNRKFFTLSALIGAGLLYAGISNTCGMSKVLAKMPWNRT